MNYITIDLAFMNKNELSPQQAMFFSYLHNALSWSEQIVDEQTVWFWVNRNKVVADIPLVTQKTDTVYRWFTEFAEMGLINYKKIGKKDVFQLTPKGKEWNNNSDSHPTKLGRPSEFYSDGHPTDSINNTNRDNIDNDLSLEEFKPMFEHFRLMYKGTKRGLDTEFKNFVSKNKDWKEVCPLLKEAYKKQLDKREDDVRNNRFVPEHANLCTYINQRRWEIVVEETEKKQEPKRYTDQSTNVW
jgi:isopentenyldiphosphate isomerase